jgi:hypothetical protein
MADPITLAVVGAGVGAMMNPNDPIKGAVIGGAAGFTGGSALGAGAAGATTAGTTVGAGGIGGAAGGTGLTATTIGGAAPASAGLGVASGGTGFTASAFPSAAGMGGGTGLLGTAGTGAAASAPFATAAGAPTMLRTNMLGNMLGSQNNQLSIAQKLVERGAQRGPNAPAIQARPATGMKLPVNQPLNYNAPLLALLEQAKVREERPMFSLL